MKPQFLKNNAVYYREAVNKVKKSHNFLQPIYEAFSNSIEAINLKNESSNPEISMNFHFINQGGHKEDWLYVFDSVEIIDNGLGFNDDEFERIKRLFDNRKGPNNKGVGRFQYLHFFNESIFSSIYQCSHSKAVHFKREFILSKQEMYLKENSIIKYILNEEVPASATNTKLKLKGLLSQKDKHHYDNLQCRDIKKAVIMHFLDYFCENKNELPNISIQVFRDHELFEEESIKASDIPEIDKSNNIEVKYVQLIDNKITELEESEKLTIKAYKLDKNLLDKNQIKLVGKGQIIKEVEFKHLTEKDSIDGNRYMFLVTGEYLDERVNEPRDDISLPRKIKLKKTLEKNYDLFEKVITMDDITHQTNEKILSMYDEIKQKRIEKNAEIEKLRKMFLLSKKSLKTFNFGLNDTDETILKKVYKNDAELIAKKDAEIKKRIDELEELDPDSNDFSDIFEKEVIKLSEQIPLQNKVTLSHYVARKKLILEIFKKTLDKKLSVQNTNKRNNNERLLHNLILPKGSNSADISGLWLISDDFIYFNGFSETELKNITIDGENIFTKDFSEEEQKYLSELGEKRLSKKPDILLFPDEGKCLIIEFKSQDVNVSNYLTQINRYASLILNYTNEELKINTFYGYLIGEKISDRDVRGNVSSFEHSIHHDYWFKPSEKVTGFDGRADGSIYTEVIKYSTLWERAKKRNSIFIDKLILSDDVND